MSSAWRAAAKASGFRAHLTHLGVLGDSYDAKETAPAPVMRFLESIGAVMKSKESSSSIEFTSDDAEDGVFSDDVEGCMCLCLEDQPFDLAAAKWAKYLKQNMIPAKEARLHARAIQAWMIIRKFYKLNHLDVLKTLNPGVTGSAWNEIMGDLSQSFPGLRAIYAGHNGQTIIPFSDKYYHEFCSLFGGISMYDLQIVMALLPLKSFQPLDDSYNAVFFPFARSLLPKRMRQIFSVRKSDSGVFIHRQTPGDALQCIYQQSIFGEDDPREARVQPGDLVVEWFFEFARRLQTRMYTCENLIPNYVSHSLVLFPRCGPETVCIIDKGIKMSVTYKYLCLTRSFVYSIRIVMLKPGEDEDALTAEERGFKTCQLFSRRLEICDGRSEARVVQGQGVIGKYPLLMEGGYRDDSQNLHNQINRGEFYPETISYISPKQEA